MADVRLGALGRTSKVPGETLPGTEEATMYANITQYLAAERARDLREQAAAARLWLGGGRADPRAPGRRAPLGLRRPS